jgi:hypothetical protein
VADRMADATRALGVCFSGDTMLATLSLLVAFTGTAEARPRHSHHGKVVVAPRGRVHFTIGVGAWSPTYVPAPRAGFRWVAGFYRHGIWSPGYWVPLSAAPAPGMVWINGHWDGDRYVDGYWGRPEEAGDVWIEGHYDDDGNWIDGRWVDPRDSQAYGQGPTSSTAAPESYEPEERGPAAIPFVVEEEDPDEVHAPPPER